jgi:hypothetical protein
MVLPFMFFVSFYQSCIFSLGLIFIAYFHECIFIATRDINIVCVWSINFNRLT